MNQEGYVPSLPKKAMVGYYLGDLGEMNISASLGFKLVDATTGAQVYQGALTLRQDYGYLYTPTPYQKVLEGGLQQLHHARRISAGGARPGRVAAVPD